MILKVGSDTIGTLADWDRALHANQGKPVQVTVLRDKKQQTLTLQVDSKHHGMLDFDGDIFDDECPMLIGGLDEDLAQSAVAQVEKLRDSLKNEDFKLDQKQMDALQKQMDEFRKNFKVEDFKIDPKQIDALKQQMDELRKNFKAEDFKPDQKQMDELKRQMEELQKTLPEKFKLELNQLEAPGRA